MFTSYVQTVFLLQPCKLKVSFATLQRLCRRSADPAYPIFHSAFPQLKDVIDFGLVAQCAPDLVINWVQVQTVLWPQVWGDKICITNVSVNVT